MSLSKHLVEQFQQAHLVTFHKPIEYTKAEQELKELAHLLRITLGSRSS